MFKMPVEDVDAQADGDGTNNLTTINFQIQNLQSCMGDTPMEQEDDQDQDPLDGQQHTNPPGNQTPAQDGHLAREMDRIPHPLESSNKLSCQTGKPVPDVPYKDRDTASQTQCPSYRAITTNSCHRNSVG